MTVAAPDEIVTEVRFGNRTKGSAIVEMARRHGNPLTTTFLDYLLPTAGEIPDVEYGHVVTPADTPGGFKGAGEGGAIGSPPAVINAVADALAPLGARITGARLGPAQVLAAVAAAGY